MISASEHYLSLNKPDRAQHLWRYTPWHRIHPTGDVDEIPENVSPILLNLTTLSGNDAPEGVSISASENMISRTVEDDVAAAFLQSLPDSSTMKIDFPDGYNSAEPLLLTIQTGSIGDCSGVQMEISVGSNSNVELLTVIEGEADWFGILRKASIHPNAILNDVVLNCSSRGKILRLEEFNLHQDAHSNLGTVNLGGERTKADIRCNLLGQGAHLQVNGSVVSKGSQHNDHHIEIKQTASDTFSRLKWHSSCSDKSRTIGTGMLRIARGAKGSDSAQVFNNLLLSKDAEADSIPELEVLESEVVGCGHGTANGPVDDEQMFYLLSRGFSTPEAEDILVSAFLNSTLKEMGSEPVHNFLDKMLMSSSLS